MLNVSILIEALVGSNYGATISDASLPNNPPAATEMDPDREAI